MKSSYFLILLRPVAKNTIARCCSLPAVYSYAVKDHSKHLYIQKQSKASSLPTRQTSFSKYVGATHYLCW